MATNNTFSRLLIVNGQPILIKNDVMDLNQAQSLGSDILQQAIDDVTSNDSISAVINCNSDDIIDSEHNTPMCIDENNTERSEYVTVLSSDQTSDETSTIRLTLEQAAELGLHFTINGMDQMLEINTIGCKEDTDTSDQNNYSIPMSLCNQQNTELSNKLDPELPCNSLVQNINILNKTNENNDYLSTLSSLDPSQNQQLSLVPQIINGTVTYTLQLSNQPPSQPNANEFFRIDNQSIVGQDSNAGNASSLKLDLNNMSTTDLSYLNSSVDLVSNKLSDKHVCNSKEGDNSCEAYGIVSCDSDNVTFLSLSDSIPVGTSVSNIVSHLNSTSTHQSKLSMSSITENNPKSKIFVTSNGGSGLLLKQKNEAGANLVKSRTSVSVQSETNILGGKNSPVTIKTKMFEKMNVCDKISSLLSIKTPFETTSTSTFNFVEKDIGGGSPSKFHSSPSSIKTTEEMDTGDADAHSSIINVGE